MRASIGKLLPVLDKTATMFFTLPKLNQAFRTLLCLTSQTKVPRCFITGDKDFGELVFRDGRLISDGVVLLRLEGFSSQMKSELVSDAIRRRAEELPNHFTVIAPAKVRIRAKKD